MTNQNNNRKAITFDYGKLENKMLAGEVKLIANAIALQREKIILESLDDKTLMKLRDSIHDELAKRGTFR